MTGIKLGDKNGVNLHHQRQHIDSVKHQQNALTFSTQTSLRISAKQGTTGPVPTTILSGVSVGSVNAGASSSSSTHTSLRFRVQKGASSPVPTTILSGLSASSADAGASLSLSTQKSPRTRAKQGATGPVPQPFCLVLL